MNMIHIVFQSPDMELLQEAMQIDSSLDAEIKEIKDDWSIGPLKNIDTDEGLQDRINWWKEIIKDSPYGEDILEKVNDKSTVRQIIQQLESDESTTVWIWLGQNPHDVTGYFWLLPQLKKFQGRVFIIFLNNLPFINEKGQLFYPRSVHDILPKEVIKAKKLLRLITVSEFEVDGDEWNRLSAESATVRILEGGKKIIGKEVSFFDTEILKNITGDWQKASRVFTNTMHRMKIKASDIFLMNRMSFLINQNIVEHLGDRNLGWKDIDVRLPQVKQQEAQILLEGL